MPLRTLDRVTARRDREAVLAFRSYGPGMRRLMSFVVVLVFTAVGQWSVPAAAWALSANACVPDSCKRLQLWSNYAALNTEDGKYLVVNASFECFDSTAAAEVDI